MSRLGIFLNKAIPYACAYGAIRKACHVHYPIQKHPYSGSDETEELYVTTKVLLVAFSAASNMYLWPVSILRDVYAFESTMRGNVHKPARDIVEVICL